MGPKPNMVSDYSRIPALLRELRLDRGYTIPYMAEQLGVSQSTVRQWEYGNRSMTLNSLVDYCRVLNASFLIVLRGALYDAVPTT